MVQDQPILVNSGEEDQELVDDPDDQQTVDPFVQQGDEQEFVDDPDVQHLNPAIEIDAEDSSSRTKNITKDEKVPTKTRTRSLTPEKAKNNNQQQQANQRDQDQADQGTETQGRQRGTEQGKDMGKVLIQVQDPVQELSQDLGKRSDLNLRETADRLRSRVKIENVSNRLFIKKNYIMIYSNPYRGGEGVHYYYS